MECIFRPIVTLDEHRFVLRVWGDEDRSTQSLRRRPLSRVLTDLKKDLTVDLSELAFADSSLILDLVMLQRRLRHAGRRMVLHAPQPHIERLIKIIGLDRLDGVSVLVPAR